MDHPSDRRAWIELMEGLGYERWGAQGGDLGCAVTDEIAKLQPAGFVGSHLTFAMFPPTPDEIENATAAERAALADAKDFWDTLSGYAKEQQTRPQTIGYSLTDSQSGWVPGSIDAICEALQSFGFQGLTVTDAIGLGKQKGPTEIYRGLRHSSAFQQASKLEIVTRDDDVDDLVDVICRVAATGRLGDGKVWITPVRELIRIRTGEAGEDALQ